MELPPLGGRQLVSPPAGAPFHPPPPPRNAIVALSHQHAVARKAAAGRRTPASTLFLLAPSFLTYQHDLHSSPTLRRRASCPAAQSPRGYGEPTRGGRLKTEGVSFTNCGYHIQMGNCHPLKKNSSGSDSDKKIGFQKGNVHVITTIDCWDEMISEASKNGKLVVANFSASWCVPCRIISRVYGELSEEYPSLVFLTVDVDELLELGSSWGIEVTPTFFFLRDGQQLDKLVGANREELLKKVVMFADSS